MPRHQRDPAFHLERWAAGFLLCVALFGVLYLGAVRTGPGQLLDQMMQRTAAGTWNPLPTLNAHREWVTVWILLPPALACAALAHQRGPHRRWIILLCGAAVALGSNITTQVIKLIWSGRPVLVGLSEDWPANSLPSGHTTMAAGAAAAAFLICRPRDRALWGVLAGIWAAGWGGYIFIEGWHLPSDMMAAYLVVAAWTLLGGAVVHHVEAKDAQLAPLPAEPGIPGGRQAGLCLTVGTMGTVIGLAALLGPVARHGLTEATASPSPWLFMAGAALSSAPAFLLSAVLIPLFSSETKHLTRTARRR